MLGDAKIGSMNISRRSILGLGGGLALTATLAACGQNNPLESTTTPAETSAPSESGSMPSGDKVDLTQ